MDKKAIISTRSVETAVPNKMLLEVIVLQMVSEQASVGNA